MNDNWHIPRASLTSSSASYSSAASLASSSNRSHKSFSNPPPVAKYSQKQQQQQQQQRHENYAANSLNKNYNSNERGIGNSITSAKVNDVNNINDNINSRQVKHKSSHNNLRKDSDIRAAPAETTTTATAIKTKRGSRSSQGSSDSNNSTRSAASGSLLLTAANLERFAEIHKNQQKQNKLYLSEIPSVHNSNATIKTTYKKNLMQAINANNQMILAVSESGNSVNVDNKINQQSSSSNNDAIITMDPNLDFIKTKDLDTVSIASSMHFTMVNGESGNTKHNKRGLCDRGRQVTVLIVSMSTVFLLLIMGMVYALEMRAREMPQS